MDELALKLHLHGRHTFMFVFNLDCGLIGLGFRRSNGNYMFGRVGGQSHRPTGYKFLASVLECSIEDIEESDPTVLINRLKNDEGHEQWSDFFTSVLKLTQKEI